MFVKILNRILFDEKSLLIIYKGGGGAKLKLYFSIQNIFNTVPTNEFPL